MKFIRNITSAEIPNRDGGRLTRISFDLDNSAVHDYIMHGGESSEPWAAMVFRQLIDELSEWSRREDFVARLLP